ncbi:aryl-alcohol oxidase 3 [Castilleja foliolosa]|uniref:Aryl-alcohol oxidase 3 n=1 Tax=Castilleja foliolosa TaxID=1961234 RepID=A0ABD3EJ50_9LAMI
METTQNSSCPLLVFYVNGERFEVGPQVDPSITLLQFLRSNTRFKSVKLSCGEVFSYSVN